MKIGTVSRLLEGESQKISADLFGFPLWYRFPADQPIINIDEAFFAMALVPAMARKESVEFRSDARVSARYLSGVNQIMEILQTWDPRLHAFPISATVAEKPSQRAGVASFFSGGVDGTFTLLTETEKVTDLILIHGLEMDLRNQARFEKVLSRNTVVAAKLGKRLVSVSTNARDFCRHVGVSMTVMHGALMASIALLLGFPETYIAASHTYAELIPWGSHPLLDPLWSTEASQIVHHGAGASRTEKVRRIAQHQEALDWLRVCGGETLDYNCGRCEKCLRTMMTLRLLKAASSALPPLSSMTELRKIRIGDQNEWLYTKDNYALATTVGDRDAIRTLRLLLRRYETRRFLKRMDQLLLKESVRRLLPGRRNASEAIAFD